MYSQVIAEVFSNTGVSDKKIPLGLSLSGYLWAGWEQIGYVGKQADAMTG